MLFIYGLDWGLNGSAAATVVAQAGMGAAFVRALLAAPADSRRPSPARIRPLARIGREILVRTTALYESFIVASAVLARIGSDSLGAHQIAFQLFVFLALVLDGILIGAGDTRFLISGMLAALLGVFVPIALLSLALDLGIVGVWVGLVGLIAVRLATCAWRFSGRRWALVGAPPS